MNLPLFGAEASGLFADHGLDVELVSPARPEAGSLDFSVTAVQSRLTARARRPEEVHPRFVAVVHQRSPLAAFVPVESPLRWPADLAGARVAASTAPWFDLEYRAGLDALGLGPPVVVPRREDGARLSLADGEVEVIGSWDEAIAVIRRRAGVPVRSIPFGPQVYTTGVVAAGSVPADVVARMVAALKAAFEQQRSHPERGLDELCRRYPGVDPHGALEEWAVLEDYVFAAGQPLASQRPRHPHVRHRPGGHGRHLPGGARRNVLFRVDGRRNPTPIYSGVVVAAAMAAWPMLMPPSLGGTWRWRSTSRPAART